MPDRTRIDAARLTRVDIADDGRRLCLHCRIAPAACRLVPPGVVNIVPGYGETAGSALWIKTA